MSYQIQNLIEKVNEFFFFGKNFWHPLFCKKKKKTDNELDLVLHILTKFEMIYFLFLFQFAYAIFCCL